MFHSFWWIILLLLAKDGTGAIKEILFLHILCTSLHPCHILNVKEGYQMFHSFWWIILLLLAKDGTGSCSNCHSHSNHCGCGHTGCTPIRPQPRTSCGCKQEEANRTDCGCRQETVNRTSCGCKHDCYTSQGEYVTNNDCGCR